jgi:heptosyltransferase-2
MKKIDRVLLIRLSSLGDILLSTPLIRLLHQKHPEAKIDYVISERYADLLRYHPHINILFEFQKSSGFDGLNQLAGKLVSADYDVILDIHNNLRSRWLTARLSGIARGTPVFRIKKQKFIRFLLVNFKINLYRKIYGRILPVWEKYCQTAAKLGISAEDSEGIPELYIDDASVQSADKKRVDAGIDPPYITMAPGARHFTKRWPAEKYAALINRIYQDTRLRTLLLGGPEDRETSQAVLDKSQKGAVANLTGNLSLLETGTIIKGSKLLVTNDSGLMHMGSAVNVPLIAIFGSTVEEFGFFPPKRNAHIVENAGLYCRPCSHIGRKNCPKGHFRCMEEISPETVCTIALKLLKKKKAEV